MLFIMERKTWWQAVDKVRIEGLAIGDTMSRQRVTQYAKVGLKFLMDRGVFEQVYKKPATPTKKRK
jgi:hypothetical protein